MFKVGTVDHEIARKADSNVLNIVIRNRSHLVHLTFPLVRLGLLDAVVTNWALLVQQPQQ